MSAESSPETRIETGEGTFEGADGHKLHMVWSIPAGAKAAVAVVHGVGEHVGRHKHIAEALSAAGYAYFGYDHRGHGKSEGRRVHVRSFDEYLADLNRFLEEVKARQKEGKIFVWGHSMGGLIATLYSIRYRPTLWGIVITSPPYKLAVQVPKAKILAAKVLSNIVPALSLANEVDPTYISRDPESVEDYTSDESIISTATVRWGAEFLNAIDVANARAKEFTLPVLIAAGTGDKITDWHGGEEFIARAQSEDKTFKRYDGFYHELHNEPTEARSEFFRDAIAWLDERAKA